MKIGYNYDDCKAVRQVEKNGHLLQMPVLKQVVYFTLFPSESII